MDRGFETYHLPGFEFSAPRGLDNYEERLIAAFPATNAHPPVHAGYARASAPRWTAGAPLIEASSGRVRAARAAAQRLDPALPLQKLFDFCRHQPRGPARLVDAERQLHDPHPRGRDRDARGLHSTTSVEPRRAYPKGGGQVFAAAPDRRGAQPRCGRSAPAAQVEQILIEGGPTTGVKCRRGVITRRWSSPAWTSSEPSFDMVGREHIRPRTAKKVQGGRMALRGSTPSRVWISTCAAGCEG